MQYHLEMKAESSSKAQRLSSDIITTLPETIIESILCFLPIEEAVRTSILTREWRYKWTKIPKLVFRQSTVKKSREKVPTLADKWTKEYCIEYERTSKDNRCKLFYAIQQVLLLHQAPIHEFTLSMFIRHDWTEVDPIILHLSRNHNIKKLTFDLDMSSSCRLPKSLFSLHNLTDLYLKFCQITYEPMFIIDLRSLTSLSLIRVDLFKESLLHILSNCPSLKSLCLLIHEGHFLGDENLSIMELFKCLPVVEHLTILGHFLQVLVKSSVPQEVPASLIHLKYCYIELMSFADVYGLTFLSVLIKCSPNLEKIKLQIDRYDHCAEPDSTVELKEYSAILEKYSDIRLEHLKELEIEYFRNLQPEMELVKFILARSDNLKKVKLLTYMLDENEELEMKKSLLGAPHASAVEFFVTKGFTDSEDDE